MFDYAVHADLLVYWTGSDIDKRYDPKWHERKSSYTDWDRVKREETDLCKKDPEIYHHHEQPKKSDLSELESDYLDRVRSILKYGLWMTTPSDIHGQPDSELTLYMNRTKNVVLPQEVARVCFTELRLSEARAHAKKYGRLGIGVKRPFLFDRGGRPIIYVGPQENRERDALFCACHKHFRNENLDLLQLLKPMHAQDEAMLAEFYAESEWRIIYRDWLDPAHPKAGYPGKKHRERCSVCVRANPRGQAFIDSLCPQDKKVAEQRLRFLLPLDGWLSCIIYPSLSLKRQALEDREGIRKDIERIKSAPECRANKVEKGNWPVEIDLDLCRNL